MKDFRGFITRKLLSGKYQPCYVSASRMVAISTPRKPGVFVIAIKQPVILNSPAQFSFIDQ